MTITQGDHLIKDSVFDDDDDCKAFFPSTAKRLFTRHHIVWCKNFSEEAIWVENTNVQYRTVMIGIPSRIDDSWCLTSDSLSSPEEYAHHHPNRAPSPRSFKWSITSLSATSDKQNQPFTRCVVRQHHLHVTNIDRRLWRRKTTADGE